MVVYSFSIYVNGNVILWFESDSINFFLEKNLQSVDVGARGVVISDGESSNGMAGFG